MAWLIYVWAVVLMAAFGFFIYCLIDLHKIGGRIRDHEAEIEAIEARIAWLKSQRGMFNKPSPIYKTWLN